MAILTDIAERLWSRRLTPAVFAPRASEDYVVVDQATCSTGTEGWHTEDVAARQETAYAPLLAQMYAGKPREDFLAGANAVRTTKLNDPVILEVGCGNGYYAEILPHLLNRPVRYSGTDFSAAMIASAKRRYPQHRFFVRDATDLGLPDHCIDIVMNGCSLLHTPDYSLAIREAHRIAAAYCIFHSVPVLHERPTAFLKKQAYGRPTVEIVFNQQELLELFDRAGLDTIKEMHCLTYNLEAIVGEPTSCKTFVCRVRS